jgi:hypothetical protein
VSARQHVSLKGPMRQMRSGRDEHLELCTFMLDPICASLVIDSIAQAGFPSSSLYTW